MSSSVSQNHSSHRSNSGINLPPGHRLLQEVQDKSEPTEEELRDYAEVIGVNPDEEPHLMFIAREGWSAPLPDHWYVCQDERGVVYYLRDVTGDKLYDHPLDDHYREKVIQARERHMKQQQQRRRDIRDVVQQKPPPPPPAIPVSQRRVSFQKPLSPDFPLANSTVTSHIPRPVHEVRRSSSSISKPSADNSKGENYDKMAAAVEEAQLAKEANRRSRELRDRYQAYYERERDLLQRQTERQLAELQESHTKRLSEEKERLEAEMQNTLAQHKLKLEEDIAKLQREEAQLRTRVSGLSEEVGSLERIQKDLQAQQHQPQVQKPPFVPSTASLEELRREEDRLELKIRRTKSLYKEYKQRKEAVHEMLYLRLYEAHGEEDENDITLSMDVTFVPPQNKKRHNTHHGEKMPSIPSRPPLKNMPPLIRSPLLSKGKFVSSGTCSKPWMPTSLSGSLTPSPRNSSSPKPTVALEQPPHSTPVTSSSSGLAQGDNVTPTGNLAQRFEKVAEEVCGIMNLVSLGDEGAVGPAWDSFFNVGSLHHLNPSRASGTVPRYMMPQLGDTITDLAHMEEASRTFMRT